MFDRELAKLFHRLKGQPVEIILNSGFKVCGISVEATDDKVVLIDSKGRPIHVQNNHIDAVLEPQKKLDRICGDDNCDCNEYDDDKRDCKEHNRRCDCD